MSAAKKAGLVVLILAVVGLAGWGGFAVHSNAQAARTLVLATTTSTEDSGLLDALLPVFEKENDVKIEVIAVGTGQALELGKNGDADILMVHAPASEKAFMDGGHGLRRDPLMYNDFVMVGPPSDPVGVKGTDSVEAAFRAVAAAGEEGKALFISRGDDSGTDKKEKGLWAEYGIDPTKAAWYDAIGSGMGETLKMAADRGAYTITDRATYLALFGPGTPGEGQLVIVHEGEKDFLNPYAVIIVDPKTHPNINLELAEKFHKWLFSEEARAIIANFGVDKFGKPLFWLYDVPPDLGN